MVETSRRKFLAALGAAAAPERSLAQHTVSTGYMVFQSSFWINLHHFLRAESRRVIRKLPPELDSLQLPDDRRTAWKQALTAYQTFADKSLIFDARLIRISNQLSQVKDAIVELSGSHSDDAEAIVALNQSASSYRVNLWNRHSDENRDWIDRHVPRLRGYEATARTRIEKVFQVKLPSQPLLVDLCRETGPALAYTVTPGPQSTCGHTVLAPQKNADADTAIDTVFHELWHTIDNSVVAAVERETARQDVTVSDDLWHAIGLYTTCHIVQNVVGKADHRDYKPKIDSMRMFSTPEWKSMHDGLEAHWMPYLRGRGTMRTALQRLVAAVAQSGRHSSGAKP